MRTCSGVVTKPMLVFLVLAAAVAGWVVNDMATLKHQTRENLANSSVGTLFANMPSDDKMDNVYFDEDGDLVADTPRDAALIAKPTELVFSFVATDNSANDAAVWQAAVDAISEKTGLPVSYLRLTDSKKQMAALRGGQLHITAFDSGSVPVAVKRAGFVPLCTIGSVEKNASEAKGAAEDDTDDGDKSKANQTEKGHFGYRMQFIVKGDGPIKDLADLRGKKVAFVRPNSNSGCKAAMVHLWKMGLRPDRDYEWLFSLSHTNSADSVANGTVDAAPVASSILERHVSKGAIEKDSYRVIYESDLFPPVSLGCAYNLSSELHDAIRAALLELDWGDTKLAQEMAPGEPMKFVPVDYRDDWASVRAVDQAVNEVRNQIAGQ